MVNLPSTALSVVLGVSAPILTISLIDQEEQTMSISKIDLNFKTPKKPLKIPLKSQTVTTNQFNDTLLKYDWGK